MSSNEWEQARAQVKKMREDGHTDDQIREMALERGWTQEQVEKILSREVLQAPPPSSPTPIPPPPSGAEPSWAAADPSRPEPQRPAAPMPRPFGVSFLVVLCDIGALFGLLGGIGALVLGGVAVSAGGGPGMGGLMMLLGFIAIAIYLGILVVGHFLWNGVNWARITFMALLGLWSLQSIPQLLTSEGRIVAVLTIAVNVLFIFILNGRGAREYCTR